MAQVLISGNTYPVKDALRTMGAKWDAERKAWSISDKKADEARKLVAAAPASAPATPGVCCKCKRVVKAPYTICFPCKNAGKCLNCMQPLDRWERQHGVKRCADCRDGGTDAHGGQSYYDRGGNFVLGDDD